MTDVGFAIFALVSFLIPIPILSWLDRPRKGNKTEFVARTWRLSSVRGLSSFQ